MMTVMSPAAGAAPTRSANACRDCGQPATAGLAPDSVLTKLCVRCAAIDSLEVPARAESKGRGPEAMTGRAAWAIPAKQAGGDEIWSHQAEALNALERGENIVLATSTASGKSLVFQTFIMDLMQEDPAATAVVLYPTKALGNDQQIRWRKCCQEMGVSPELIGQIDGNINTNQRDRILANSRIVVMTPDVCHAWMTRLTHTKVIREFLSGLKAIVIDEAHTYESVFGSNSAYLFRRLSAAAADAGREHAPQYVAATATIQDPAEHLRKLTGQNFTVIGEDQNGAPRHHREILHIPCGRSTEEKHMAVSNLIINIIDADPEAQVIAFCDSRQGVERIVQIVDRPDTVLPYRSGYRGDERREIEEKVRNNQIRAVVATSALELGIDMPDLSYGIQLELPQSRKQFHQRLGRVGRAKPGTFILLAPADRLTMYGDTLQGYYEKMVEASHLYLGNEYISYAQALCLSDELRRRGKPSWELPSVCQWPEGFAGSLAATQGMTPEHLLPLTSYARDRNPHIAYSIRSTGEDTLVIREQDPRGGPGGKEREIGDISVSAAMQEAYPGAIYRHRGDSYRVEEWRRERKTNDAFIRAVKIRDTSERTRPVLQRVVEINPTPELVLGHRYETASIGAIGLVMAQITESVEGYSSIRGGWSGGEQEPVIYRTESQKDPRKTRKQRTFPTTAMVIRINEPWFKGEQGEPVLARMELAEAPQASTGLPKKHSPTGPEGDEQEHTRGRTAGILSRGRRDRDLRQHLRRPGTRGKRLRGTRQIRRVAMRQPDGEQLGRRPAPAGARREIQAMADPRGNHPRGKPAPTRRKRLVAGNPPRDARRDLLSGNRRKTERGNNSEVMEGRRPIRGQNERGQLHSLGRPHGHRRRYRLADLAAGNRHSETLRVELRP